MKGGGALHIAFAPVWSELYWPVAGLALRAGHWAVVTGVGVQAAAVTAVDRGVNICRQVTLAVIACVALRGIGYDLAPLAAAGERRAKRRRRLEIGGGRA